MFTQRKFRLDIKVNDLQLCPGSPGRPVPDAGNFCSLVSTLYMPKNSTAYAAVLWGLHLWRKILWSSVWLAAPDWCYSRSCWLSPVINAPGSTASLQGTQMPTYEDTACFGSTWRCFSVSRPATATVIIFGLIKPNSTLAPSSYGSHKAGLFPQSLQATWERERRGTPAERVSQGVAGEGRSLIQELSHYIYICICCDFVSKLWGFSFYTFDSHDCSCGIRRSSCDAALRAPH